jgi:hypothetical protein
MTAIIDMSNLETRKKVVLITVISALTIEVKHGIKMSRGVQPMAVLKRDYGFTNPRKLAGLKFAIERLQELDPEYVVSERTLEALNK